MRGLALFLLATVISSAAQNNPEQNPQLQKPTAEGTETVTVENGQSTGIQNPQPTSLKQITVPAGTEVPLILRSAIDTKNTRIGDGVYCQTAFPVVVDNTIVIPAGTYVKGEVVKAQRAGKIKGRAEILFKFNTLIFPSGYTVEIPGTIHHDSGSGGEGEAEAAEDPPLVFGPGFEIALRVEGVIETDAGFGVGALARGGFGG